MEATTEEQQPGTLVHHILPPRLEDAGLEDCALPPDSIKQAFLKAATAVKSRATSLFTDDEEEEEEEDCVRDPWPAVVGAVTEGNPPGACGGDEVVVGGEEEKRDKVVVGGEDVREVGGDKACVDGLVGLEIEEKKNEGKNDEGPILVGGYA
ncbi:uncharacterized protein LOC133729552 [Rosa rugosa]|uniref:uncharacterized protein LOC133729552 n=1 Tax=Rosa rugosa TaxID=74645 RepID=UPI002B417C75|nr:uncharacterized protein LOC133729552 [Rosa rugosa]